MLLVSYFFLGHRSILEQLSRVFLVDGNHLFDFGVHHWLGKARFIKLVVTEESISDDINHHILMELISIINCQSKHSIDHIRLICIYVENRSFNSFHDICRVKPRSVFCGSCCETNLIVNNDMDDSLWRVTNKRLHL